MHHGRIDVFPCCRRSLSTGALALVAVAGLVIAGCGERVETGTVSGKVTYKGKPLEFGTVMLQPAAGGPFATGQIGPDGSYSVSTDDKPGAPLGMNKVRVTCYSGERPGSSGTSTGGEVSLGDSLIPEHYTKFSSSGLQVEVTAGENTYDIAL